MAISFANVKGSAVKNKVDQYVYKDGDNRIRIVGDILARYVYWVKGENKKDIPFECLAFNRSTESFDNAEKDWVKIERPELKCSWAYAVQCIDPSDGKLKVLNLKKKLWEAVMLAAEDLGDPTDHDTGWDIVFRKAKTGPLPINVEYQLQVLKCKPRALTDAERQAVVDIKSMDDVLPRPTSDAQKELLNKLRSGATGEAIDEEIDEEFAVK
jgi:hypothetical protein